MQLKYRETFRQISGYPRRLLARLTAQRSEIQREAKSVGG